jgi:DNA-binding CsgD family transcriptional regulator/PAS domain-containing protein
LSGEALSHEAPDLYERATHLIELLFEAPARPKGWREFLGALCRELSTDAVAVLYGQLEPNKPPHLIAHGVDVRRAAREIPKLREAPPPDELPAGTLLDLATHPLFATSPFHQLVLAKEGVTTRGFGLVMARSETQITGALLVLSRDPAWEATEDDRALLELLSPYVRRAAMLGIQLNERQRDVETLLALFDALALGVVLLDDKSRVTFANRSAEEILGSRAGRAASDDPTAVRERRTAALRALLRSRAVGACGAAAYPHPEDGRPLQIVSTPLHWPYAAAGIAARFAQALFLGDPELASRNTSDGLVALYGLTPAEARLASLLAAGSSLHEAAETLGIQVSTARGVLKAVFAKTGTRRQASLVRVILAALGQLRPGAPREPGAPLPERP